MYRILENDIKPDAFLRFPPVRSGQLKGLSRRVQKPRTDKISMEYRFSYQVINSWNLLTDSKEDHTLRNLPEEQ